MKKELEALKGERTATTELKVTVMLAEV